MYQQNDQLMSYQQQYKKLNENRFVSCLQKADILKILKMARQTKKYLAQKLKVDLNILTKASATYVKVLIPGCQTWLNDFERQVADDSQFVLLEMPSNNLITGYNSLDEQKKFVFEAYKNLATMLKFM